MSAPTREFSQKTVTIGTVLIFLLVNLGFILLLGTASGHANKPSSAPTPAAAADPVQDVHRSRSFISPAMAETRPAPLPRPAQPVLEMDKQRALLKLIRGSRS